MNTLVSIRRLQSFRPNELLMMSGLKIGLCASALDESLVGVNIMSHA